MTTTSVDLDEVEPAVRERIARLGGRRQELALDALTKKTAATELAQVESDLVSAEGELERVRLARVEQDRRAELAHAAEIARRRAAAMKLAGEIGAQRREAACAIDEALGVLAERVAVHRRLVSAQAVQLEAAGRKVSLNSYRMVDRAFEHALARAFGAHGVRGALELQPLTGRDIVPFADGDPAPLRGG